MKLASESFGRTRTPTAQSAGSGGKVSCAALLATEEWRHIDTPVQPAKGMTVFTAQRWPSGQIQIRRDAVDIQQLHHMFVAQLFQERDLPQGHCRNTILSHTKARARLHESCSDWIYTVGTVATLVTFELGHHFV